MSSLSHGSSLNLSRHRGGRRLEASGRTFGDGIREKKLKIIGNEIRLLTGTSNPQLAQEVANILQVELQKPVSYFNNNPEGEMDINIGVSLRQHAVFIMQSALPRGVNNGLQEVNMMLDASRRGSSGERTVFYAPMPYQRKDRPDDQQKPDAKRQAIGARVVLKQMESNGADRFQTVELHAQQEVGFTDLPYDALYGSAVLVPALQETLIDPPNTVYLSPDYGGGERARKWNEFLGGAGFGHMNKKRSPDGVTSFGIIANVDVRGKHVTLVDDVLSTGTSLRKISGDVIDSGALSVSAAVTHGEFIYVPEDPNKDPDPVLLAIDQRTDLTDRQKCIQKLAAAGISSIMCTDTIPQGVDVRESGLVQVVPIAPLIAKAFIAVATGMPIHEIHNHKR